MGKEKSKEAEIGAYVSALLRKHFGKGPASVYVVIRSPFIAVHFRGFLAPMEKVQIKQNEENRVLKTRDLLMEDLIGEIIQELKKMAGLDIEEIYTDWNLEKETGLILGVSDEEISEDASEWLVKGSKKEMIKRIKEASDNVQVAPDKTEIYWLNERMLLVKRTKILIELEKELIKNGLGEDLKIAKRPLEQKAFEAMKLDNILQRNITETFLYWNFTTNIGYTVFILEPQKQQKRV